MKNTGNADEIIQNLMTPYRAYLKIQKILLGKSRARQNHVKRSDSLHSPIKSNQKRVNSVQNK